jgi:hypothetical protein
LASAWLILRFIDPSARILWLNSPDDCPDDAIGFDFDGAQFCHIGNLVTFETLQASFAINKPGLERLAAWVHYLMSAEPSQLRRQGEEYWQVCVKLSQMMTTYWPQPVPSSMDF